MKTAEIKADIRENVGTGGAAHSRRNDKIPAVVYGEHGVQHIEVDYNSMAKLVLTPDLYLINLEVGKDTLRVIVQDAQFHPVTDRIIHIDFLEAAVGKTAKLNIPVNIVGSSKGVLDGGQLVVKMRKLRVKGTPAELPEAIDVDITDLDIGKSIKISDIPGYEFLDPENSVIVRVKMARSAEELALLDETGEEVEEVEEGEEGEGVEGEEGAEVAEGAEGAEARAEGGEAKKEGAPSEAKSE